VRPSLKQPPAALPASIRFLMEAPPLSSRLPRLAVGPERSVVEGPAVCFPQGYDERMHVLVYSATWCRDCREAKRFLDKHQISYSEIDIESTPGAAEELIRHVGKRAIPQFVIDGKWIQPYRPGQGFLHQEMSELFGVGGPETSLHPR
jgi:mycoredoxin